LVSALGAYRDDEGAFSNFAYSFNLRLYKGARALSRLQDGGDANDFSEDAITSAFVELLGAEKNKVGRCRL
jgi:hypothetical protein